MKHERKELIRYRLSNGEEKLRSAKILLENGQFKDSTSRSYYAMFSAARALLVTRNLNSTKHSGIISLFNQHFVKTGLVDRACGRILMNAREIREKGDYGDFYLLSKKEAELQLKNAEIFIEEIKRAIEKLEDRYNTS
ncbi:MAG: HEPN domain-containing protein [bacterium]